MDNVVGDAAAVVERGDVRRAGDVPVLLHDPPVHARDDHRPVRRRPRSRPRRRLGRRRSPPPRPRRAAVRDLLGRRRAAPTWNIVPNQRDAIIGTTLSRRPQTVFPTVVYRRYTAHWQHAAAERAARSSNQDLIPGPLLRARVGDRIVVHFKNLDTLPAPALDALPRRALPAELRRRLPAGLLGPRRRRQARADVDLPAARGPRLGRRLALPRPLALDGRVDRRAACTGCSRSSAATSARPTASSWSSSPPMGQFQTIDGRAFVGNTPVFTLARRPARAVGRDGDGLRAPHLPRARPPLAARRTAPPRDTQTVGPAESFRIRWREEDPGTWLYHCHVEAHMMAGMIGIYRVTRDEAARRLPSRRACVARSLARRRPRRSASTSHGAGGRRAPTSRSCFDRLRAARTSTSLAGDTVHVDATTASRTHTVTADDGAFDSGALSSAATFTRTLRRARRRRLPLHAAPVHARRGRRAPRCCSTRPAEPAAPGRAVRAHGPRRAAGGTAGHDRGATTGAGFAPGGDGDRRRRRQLRASPSRRGTSATLPRASPAARRARRCSCSSLDRTVARDRAPRGRTVVRRARVTPPRPARPSCCSCTCASTSAGGRCAARAWTGARARASRAPAAPRRAPASLLTLPDGATPLAVSPGRCASAPSLHERRRRDPRGALDLGDAHRDLVHEAPATSPRPARASG